MPPLPALPDLRVNGSLMRCTVMVNRTPGESCYEPLEGPFSFIPAPDPSAQIAECSCPSWSDLKPGEECPDCGEFNPPDPSAQGTDNGEGGTDG